MKRDTGCSSRDQIQSLESQKSENCRMQQCLIVCHKNKVTQILAATEITWDCIAVGFSKLTGGILIVIP